jgi:hypothetical protein
MQPQITETTDAYSLLVSEDDRAMNICIIPVPQEWLDREFPVYDIPEGTF